MLSTADNHQIQKKTGVFGQKFLYQMSFSSTNERKKCEREMDIPSTPIILQMYEKEKKRPSVSSAKKKKEHSKGRRTKKKIDRACKAKKRGNETDQEWS
jgi:hypothetical protein